MHRGYEIFCAALAQWLKTGKMPIWDESPGFKSQMHKKSGKILKTTREGHRIPHSDMRWLVTDVRGRRDNSNNGKDLWTLLDTHKSGLSRSLTRDRSPARLKLSGCRCALTSVLKVNSDEVDKGALTKGRRHSWLETTKKALRGPKRRSFSWLQNHLEDLGRRPSSSLPR